MSVWLIAQSIAGLLAGSIIAMQTATSLKSTSAMWTYPVMALFTIAVGIALYVASERLSKIVSQ